MTSFLWGKHKISEKCETFENMKKTENMAYPYPSLNQCDFPFDSLVMKWFWNALFSSVGSTGDHRWESCVPGAGDK